MFLELSEPDDGSAFGRTTIELFADVFSRQAVARTREIARLQAALAASTPTTRSGRCGRTCSSMELVLELAGVGSARERGSNHPSGHPGAGGASP